MNNSYRFKSALLVSTIMSSLLLCNSAEAMFGRVVGSAVKFPSARKAARDLARSTVASRLASV